VFKIFLNSSFNYPAVFSLKVLRFPQFSRQQFCPPKISHFVAQLSTTCYHLPHNVAANSNKILHLPSIFLIKFFDFLLFYTQASPYKVIIQIC
jgi:hypothetical protein